MKKNVFFKLVVAIAFIPQLGFAWTLSGGQTTHFPSDTVELNVATNDSCTNAGVTHDQLLDDAFKAADQYWNRVPTSRLRFIKGSKKAVASYDPTAGTSGGVKGEVLIGCKNDGNFAASGAIAFGGQSYAFPDGTIKTAFVAVDGSATSTYSTTAEAVKRAILAHEIGHAIGLGHSERDSLMYYSLPPERTKLGEDDMAAVTYLYPRRDVGLGILGTCGTIEDINKNNSGSGMQSFLLTLFSGFILVLLLWWPLQREKKCT